MFLYSPHMVRYIEPIFLICLYWAKVQYVFLFSGYAISSNFPSFFSFFLKLGTTWKKLIWASWTLLSTFDDEFCCLRLDVVLYIFNEGISDRGGSYPPGSFDIRGNYYSFQHQLKLAKFHDDRTFLAMIFWIHELKMIPLIFSYMPRYP